MAEIRPLRALGFISLVTVLLVCFAAMSPVASAAQETEDAAAELEEEILRLRSEARYGEAAELAKDLLALRQSDPEAKPWQLADAERLVGTLQYVAALEEDQRRELAAADSLAVVVEGMYAEGRYADAAVAAARQLEIRRSLLGEKHPDVAESLNDLAVLYPEELRVYINMGGFAGPFREIGVIDVPGGMGPLCVGELSGDGLPDVLVAREDGKLQVAKAVGEVGP